MMISYGVLPPSLRQPGRREFASGTCAYMLNALASRQQSDRTHSPALLHPSASHREECAMDTVPQWHLAGDWFDVCSCDIPCPCEFAQAPTDNACQGVLAWHIRTGHYGDVQLDGLNLVALGAFEGNLWTGDAKATLGLFIEERANERQRQALQTIFAGQAGGWPAAFAS